jgi:hypothetical protein
MGDNGTGVDSGNGESPVPGRVGRTNSSKGSAMIRIRVIAILAGLLIACVGAAASAATAVTFHVRYFAEGGSSQTYLLAGRGAAVVGDAWLGSEAFDQRRARTLTVCDRSRDDADVRARVLVPDGRRIAYLAPVGPHCFVRDLGYPIVNWQLSVGKQSSGAVSPPELA